MNFGNGDEIYISTPACLRRMAEMVRDWDVKPELEVFELGQIRFARQMMNGKGRQRGHVATVSMMT